MNNFTNTLTKKILLGNAAVFVINILKISFAGDSEVFLNNLWLKILHMIHIIFVKEESIHFSHRYLVTGQFLHSVIKYIIFSV
jgi:hypothetical protein